MDRDWRNYRRYGLKHIKELLQRTGTYPGELFENSERVLVVYDDPEVVEVLVRALERSGGLEVDYADDGYTVGSKGRGQVDPDLAILDIMPPGIKGTETCQRIRVDPNTSHIKVIGMTGYPEHRDDFLPCGAEKCFEKPLDIEALVKEITGFLVSANESQKDMVKRK